VTRGGQPLGNDRRTRIGTRVRRLGRLLLAAAAAAIALTVTWHALVRWLPYPDDCAQPPPLATWLCDQRGQPLLALTADDGHWHLPIDRSALNPWLIAAVVAVEDRRFRDHAGVDWTALVAATAQNAWARRVVRGGSTLTMQVQRLRQPRPRTLATKLIESLRAAQLERVLDKDAILAEWLDRAPFGGNLRGAEAASRWWFALPSRDLTLAQAALLAGLPQSPERLRPDRHPDAARARRDHVLRRLGATGAISAAALTQALAEPLTLARQPLPQNALPAALPALVACAREHAGGERRTSLDSAACRTVQALLDDQLAAVPGVAGAAVVLDTVSGALHATASRGRDGLDLARCRRSTGSALKPFLYAAAFADGWCSPDTVVDDRPRAWGAYVPANFDRRFRGRMTAATALAESRNLPAIDLLDRLGPVRAAEVLAACGLDAAARAVPRAGLSLAVGGAEASAWELAGAFATLARGGRRRAPRIDAGEAGPGTSALPERACRQVLAALADPDRTAACCRAAVDLEPAWKTGTSSGPRDAWCLAATPRLTVAVWLGDPTGGEVPALSGGGVAAPLALGVLAALDRGGPSFPPPPAALSAAAALPVPPPRLTLTSPLDGARLLRDDDQPAIGQRLCLTAHGGDGPRWWFVDGDLVGRATADQPLWWPLAAGAHVVRVVDALGATAQARVVVR